MKFVPSLTTLSICIGLTACGGGGGGGSVTPPPPAEVAITSANQDAVARSIVSGGMALALAQPLAAPGHASALAASVQGAAPSLRTVSAVVQRVAQLAWRQPGPQRARPLAASPETEPCGDSGTMTTTFDDRDNDGTPSAGDVLTVAFSHCKETGEAQIDGSVVLQIASVILSSGSDLDLSGIMSFTGVTTLLGATSASLSGSVSASVAMHADSLQVALTVGTDGLRVGASSPGYSEHLAYETGMRMSFLDQYTGTPASSFTLDGSYTAESLGGRLSVATPQAIRQLGGDAFASSGRIVATGDADSQLRVTVVDGSQVRLELDADGDGTFEGSELVGWSTLAPN